MGVKRFLVAGGMASLVLIGVGLIDETKGLAKNGGNGAVSIATGAIKECRDSSSLAGCSKAAQSGASEIRGEIQMGKPPSVNVNTQENGGPPPSPSSGPAGPPPSVPADTDMELALGGDGTSSVPASPPPGGDTGGAVDSDGDPTLTLPDTGGSSVFLLPTAGPLLLAIAMILGSLLLVAAFVRLVRS